jgi:hypothetical protein
MKILMAIIITVALAGCNDEEIENTKDMIEAIAKEQATEAVCKKADEYFLKKCVGDLDALTQVGCDELKKAMLEHCVVE